MERLEKFRTKINPKLTYLTVIRNEILNWELRFYTAKITESNYGFHIYKER